MEELKALYWQVREDVDLNTTSRHLKDAVVDAAHALHKAGLMDNGLYDLEMTALGQK